jgi:hypothetical protein
VSKTNDVFVNDCGSIVVLTGISKSGSSWLEENIGHATRFGTRYVCEPRYADDIIAGIINDGLRIGQER